MKFQLINHGGRLAVFCSNEEEAGFITSLMSEDDYKEYLKKEFNNEVPVEISVNEENYTTVDSIMIPLLKGQEKASVIQQLVKVGLTLDEATTLVDKYAKSETGTSVVAKKDDGSIDVVQTMKNEKNKLMDNMKG